MVVKEDLLKKILIEHNLVPAVKFEDLVREAEESKVELKTLLLNKKIISEKDLAKLISEASGIPFVDLAEVQVPREVLKKLPEKYARKYKAAIFEKGEDGQYSLAMADAGDIQAVQFIEKEFGAKLKVYAATPGDIAYLIDQYKDEFSAEISKAIQENKEISLSEETLEENATADSVKEIVQEAPIARAVDIILEYALKSRASDIHIEPRETFIQVRYRIDGVLRDTMTLPKQIMSSIVTRIKIISSLRIDEHRIPQDGRIKINMAGKAISVRVSTLPVMDGEKVVMRLLDETTKAASLEELGFRGLGLEIIKKNLYRPHGMTLVTGPTGSGKSTTLYSLLTLLNDIGVNISTVEDPVEYRIPGVNQTQVNAAIGMTFASGLRALLRQDPDIIMVGEIRDKETAEMGVHASLTGHVVLSTLHTNSAAGSLPRLEDMGVEPFLIASTVNTVIGQRLVRKLCDHCKQPYKPEIAAVVKMVEDFKVKREFLLPEKNVKLLLKKMGVSDDSLAKAPAPEKVTSLLGFLGANEALNDEVVVVNDKKMPLSHQLFAEDQKPGRLDAVDLTLYKAVGCNKCEQSGYKGRMGIYEVMEVTEELGGLIVRKATEDEIVRVARKDGMLTMQQDGFLKALEGITTIEEIIRVTKE